MACYDKKGKIIPCPKGTTNGTKIFDNLKDFKLAQSNYNDSLTYYNRYKNTPLSELKAPGTTSKIIGTHDYLTAPEVFPKAKFGSSEYDKWDQNIATGSGRDLINDKSKLFTERIKPTHFNIIEYRNPRDEWDNFIYQGVYKKPVQPIVYKKEPTKIPYDKHMNVDGYNALIKKGYDLDGEFWVKKPKEPEVKRLNFGKVSPIQPEASTYLDNMGFNYAIPETNPQLPNLPYRVEYTDEAGQETHRDFIDNKTGEEFQKNIGGNRKGYYKMKNGGKIQNMKKKKLIKYPFGTEDPIIPAVNSRDVPLPSYIQEEKNAEDIEQQNYKNWISDPRNELSLSGIGKDLPQMPNYDPNKAYEPFVTTSPESWFDKNRYDIEMAANFGISGLNKILGDKNTKREEQSGTRRALQASFDSIFNPYVNGTGSQAIMAKGGKLKGNGTQVLEGGTAKQISASSQSNPMFEFKGNTHAEGGIAIQHGSKQAEVEHGEVGWVDPEGALNIFGKLNVPGTNKKFKTVAKDLAEAELDITKQKAKSLAIINKVDPQDKYAGTAFETAKVMFLSQQNQANQITAKKQELADTQNILLNAINESQKVAKYGAKLDEIPKYATGGKIDQDISPEEKKALIKKYIYTDNEFQGTKDMGNKTLEKISSQDLDKLYKFYTDPNLDKSFKERVKIRNINNGKIEVLVDQYGSVDKGTKKYVDNALKSYGIFNLANATSKTNSTQPATKTTQPTQNTQTTTMPTQNPPKKGKLNSKVDPRLQTLYDMIEKSYDIKLSSDFRPGDKKQHGKGGAFDAVFNKLGSKAYETILGDKNIVKYMSQNGITAINEYDPAILKQTGGTGPHLHFGFDQGTKIADQFRLDANLKGAENFTNFFAGNKNFQRNQKTGLPEMTEAYDHMYDKNYLSTMQKASLAPPAILSTQNTTPSMTAPQTTQAIQSVQNTQSQDPQQAGGGRAMFAAKPINSDAVVINNSSRIRDFQSPLDVDQITPELLTITGNSRDAVPGLSYQPQLKQTFDTSFQLGRNENQASFNQAARIAESMGDTSALYNLAAQKFKADESYNNSEVQGNATNKLQIYNDNTNTLNDAGYKNLQLVNDQQEKMAAGKAAQQAAFIGAMSGITGKVQQNKLENLTYNAYANLFPDYGFDSKGNKTFDRTSAIQWLPGSGASMAKIASIGKTIPDTEIQTVDANGNVTTKTVNKARTPAGVTALQKLIDNGSHTVDELEKLFPDYSGTLSSKKGL